MNYSQKSELIKKDEEMPVLNFAGDPGVPFLNFEMNAGVLIYIFIYLSIYFFIYLFIYLSIFDCPRKLHLLLLVEFQF